MNGAYLVPCIPSKVLQGQPQANPLNDDVIPAVMTWTKVYRADGSFYFFRSVQGVQAFTHDDPFLWPDGTTLDDTVSFIRRHLPAQASLRDISIVVGLPGYGEHTAYYMVDERRHQIFWLDDHDLSPLRIRNIPACCTDALLCSEYWYHVHYFPPNRMIAGAEHGLIVRLWAYVLPGYEGLGPWSPDRCREHLQIIEANRAALVSARSRMTVLGLLLSQLYQHEFENMHRHHNNSYARHTRLGQVSSVEKRKQNWYGWTVFFKILLDLDRPLILSMLYSVQLTGANLLIQSESDLLSICLFGISVLALIASLMTAMFLLPMYSFAISHLFERRNNAPFRNWHWTCLLGYNAFVYGYLLSTFGGYLSPPEHPFATLRPVMVTFALALPPAYHIVSLLMLN